MAKAEFTKGQKVVVYNVDFHTCNITATEYTVLSCGTKQMHLLRNDGSNAEFRLSAPFRRERMYSDVQCASVDRVAYGAKFRALCATWTRAHYAHCTAVAERLTAEGVSAKGYTKAIAEAKARFEAATADIA